MKTNKRFYLLGIAGLMSLNAGPVAAQRSAPALEEIVVTAQRREENLQSTPVSVASFSSDRLRDMSATSIADMAAFVPNLSLGNATGRAADKAAISIRGINEALGSIGTSPAVGIYIDDVYYGQPQIQFLRLIDVERVEILRGPQGTLFGRNSLGGAIRYITAKPEFDDVSGYVSTTMGDYSRMDVSGAVNIPFSDTVALRLKAATLSSEGYVDRLADNQSLGAENTQYASAQLRWQPSDRLDVNLGVDYTLRDTDTGPQKLIDYFNFNGGFAPTGGDGGPPAFTGGAASSRAWNSVWGGTYREYNAEIPNSLYQVAGTGSMPRLRSESTGVTLNISYDINDSVNLRSITGYRTVDDYRHNELDDSSVAIAIFDDTTEEGVDFWSQEFQFSGSTERLNWTAGVYYSQENPYLQGIDGRDPRAGFAYGAINTNDTGNMEITHSGIFAQGTFDITEKLAFTLGLRYAEDEKDYRVSQVATWDAALAAEAIALGLAPLAPPASFGCDVVTLGTCVSIPQVRATNTQSSFTPRIALEYQWNDDLMTYAAVSEGFKTGGPNDTAEDIGISFPAEEVTSYEIGVRSEMMDGRLRANATYFFTDNTDKQITVAPTVAAPGSAGFVSPCFGRCIFSAGDAEIQGIEIDVAFAATERLQLHGNLGTIDAKWVRVVPGGPARLGSTMAYAPELSYNVGGVYHLPMASGANLSFLLDYSFKDEQESSQQDSTTLTIPSYDLLTLRLKYEDPDGRWEASVFCTNCADEEYITGGNAWGGSTDNTVFNYKPANHPGFLGGNTSPNFIVVPEVSYVLVGAPRMMGVDFRYNF
ncbi:MAG: hypothetical protein COA71_08530 [SAR86 cluster bacterium]|uniref:TonB-dependent receptor n=1 Tax=SAR86 cluster bacterium TaxID=2030880 RepID=A0A2A5CB23_9GAMM|nr:TonB-dependent receptor [Gammaproteobacteria bacterium AH-315-E17]PCJ41084.1 MAG: hypothetical protein COA71_08530 [SAR86 cluster bacterium]